MGWHSFTHAITKPFQQIGRAIHWTDIRYPVIGAALGGVGLGIGAALGAGISTGVGVAAVGGGAMVGMQAGGQHLADKAQKVASAESAAEAQRAVAASNMPIAQVSPQSQMSSVLSENTSASDARRRYSLQRTVNNYSLRSSLGGGRGNRYSLG